jgi:hypothetical protein
VSKRKLIAAMMAGSMLFLGVACDDKSPEDTQQLDEVDSRPGPGDGSDETGPGR